MNKQIAKILLVLLAGALLLAGCSPFDGTTLKGTTWGAEVSEDLTDYGMGSYTERVTVKFTSDAAGKVEVKVTKWEGTWTEEQKEKIEGMVAEDSGDFTYTYNPEDHTGTVSFAGDNAYFTVDVAAKTLTLEGEQVLKLR